MDPVLDDFNPHRWAKSPAAKVVGPVFDGQPQVVAFGGGTDSTAMLIGLRDAGLRPDRILFADTGGERDETYDFVGLVSAWCQKSFGVSIEWVHRTRRDQTRITLEGWSLEKAMLPSLAYGYKKCSQKFKIAPQDKALNHWPPAKACWKAGRRVLKYIGYEAGEERRVRPQESKDGKYFYQYPLIAWGWGREKCREVIRKEGFPQPGKSSCFFCPATKKAEILALSDDHKKRAVELERRAAPNLTKVKGLGRYFSWGEFLSGSCPLKDASEHLAVPCDCYDGVE